MTSKTVEVSILNNGSICAIPVPFDPKAVFGKVRAPVKVTVNGCSFRSTIARMGGQTFIPLRQSHREAAAVAAGDRVKVRIAADAEPRAIEAPPDLARALKAKSGLWKQWGELSFTHQREHAEAVLGAKKPETRERRIAKAVEFVAAKAASKAASRAAAGRGSRTATKVELRFRLIVRAPLAGVTYAVQRGRSALIAPARSSKAELVFEFPLTLADVEATPPRLTGEFAQGPAQQRFVYVNSGRAAGQRGTQWGRRAKVPLYGISRQPLQQALARQAGTAIIEASIEGVGKDGGPACASVPLLSEWAIRKGGSK